MKCINGRVLGGEPWGGSWVVWGHKTQVTLCIVVIKHQNFELAQHYSGTVYVEECWLYS